MRLLKEKLLRIHACHDVDDLNAALQAERERYNEQWIVECYGYISPGQIRSDRCQPLVAAA